MVALVCAGMVLRPSSVRANSVTFDTSIGADFQGGVFQSLSTGFSVGGVSDVGGRFLFGNPLAPPVILVSAEGVTTGPLISHHHNSWTFAGGNVYAQPDGEAVSLLQFPPLGYSTCEAAGFITFEFGGCILTPVLSGTLIGNTVLTLGDPVFDAHDDGFAGTFDLTGPVTFGINMDLARAGEISAGPYFGSLRVDGFYFQDASGVQDGYHFQYDGFEVSGATPEPTPEPSALLLFATGIATALTVTNKRTR
jgi:hypothetical protein